jgi:phosphatidylserine/phosphatidylglycerophosphate/cardiolipin synthase-like enzyme
MRPSPSPRLPSGKTSLQASSVRFRSSPTPTEVFFSPNGGTSARIVQEINRAQSTIDVAIYSFTRDEIADALIAAKNRGVAIRILAKTSPTDSRLQNLHLHRPRSLALNHLIVGRNRGRKINDRAGKRVRPERTKSLMPLLNQRSRWRLRSRVHGGAGEGLVPVHREHAF